MNSQPPTSTGLESLLGKYIYVWLWSIVFGAAIGLSLIIADSRSLLRLGVAEVVYIPIFLIGAIVTMLAWAALYRYLIYFLIPAFFFDDGAEEFEDNRRAAAQDLRAAFRYLFIDLILIFVTSIVGLILQAAQFIADYYY